jgi:PST family polysaccharide transporter
LSEYQDQKEIIYRKYVSILKILSSACLFIVPVFYCCSQEIILLFYGGQWGEAVLPFHYLSLAVYPLLLMSTTGSIYQSANNTKLLFVAGAINAAVTFAFIAGGLATGSVANVALSVGIANWINMCVTFFILMRFVLKAPVLAFAKVFAPDIVLMALFVALQSYLSRWLPSGSLWVSLMTKGAVAAACYLAYLVLTGRLKALLAAIRKRTGKGAQGACKEGDAQ